MVTGPGPLRLGPPGRPYDVCVRRPAASAATSDVPAMSYDIAASRIGGHRPVLHRGHQAQVARGHRELVGTRDRVPAPHPGLPQPWRSPARERASHPFRITRPADRIVEGQNPCSRAAMLCPARGVDHSAPPVRPSARRRGLWNPGRPVPCACGDAPVEQPHHALDDARCRGRAAVPDSGRSATPPPATGSRLRAAHPVASERDNPRSKKAGPTFERGHPVPGPAQRTQQTRCHGRSFRCPTRARRLPPPALSPCPRATGLQQTDAPRGVTVRGRSRPMFTTYAPLAHCGRHPSGSSLVIS
jgi:hypothetical protein